MRMMMTISMMMIKFQWKVEQAARGLAARIRMNFKNSPTFRLIQSLEMIIVLRLMIIMMVVMKIMMMRLMMIMVRLMIKDHLNGHEDYQQLFALSAKAHHDKICQNIPKSVF